MLHSGHRLARHLGKKNQRVKAADLPGAAAGRLQLLAALEKPRVQKDWQEWPQRGNPAVGIGGQAPKLQMRAPVGR